MMELTTLDDAVCAQIWHIVSVSWRDLGDKITIRPRRQVEPEVAKKDAKEEKQKGKE